MEELTAEERTIDKLKVLDPMTIEQVKGLAVGQAIQIGILRSEIDKYKPLVEELATCKRPNVTWDLIWRARSALIDIPEE